MTLKAQLQASPLTSYLRVIKLLIGDAPDFEGLASRPSLGCAEGARSIFLVKKSAGSNDEASRSMECSPTCAGP